MEYVVEPLGRSDLRNFANQFRKSFGLENELYFPVVEFLEFVMPFYFEGFHYEIVGDDYFSDDRHGETDVVNRIIRIREDVYLGAVNGQGRDRMTIMHEIAHYLLLVHYGVKFNRSFGPLPKEAYVSPEWQAKALAGEIMCPAHQINTLSVAQIMQECGVSQRAAEVNLERSNSDKRRR